MYSKCVRFKIFVSSSLALELNSNDPIGQDYRWDNPLCVAQSHTRLPDKRNGKPEVLVVRLQNNKHEPTFKMCVRIYSSLVLLTILNCFVRFI